MYFTSFWLKRTKHYTNWSWSSKILFTLKESQRLSSVLPSIANLTFVNLHGSNLYTRLLKLG